MKELESNSDTRLVNESSRGESVELKSDLKKKKKTVKSEIPRTIFNCKTIKERFVISSIRRLTINRVVYIVALRNNSQKLFLQFVARKLKERRSRVAEY